MQGFECQYQSMYYLFFVIQFVNRNHWRKPCFLTYSQYTILVTSKNLRIQVSRHITLRWVNVSWYFEGSCCLHLTGSGRLLRILLGTACPTILQNIRNYFTWPSTWTTQILSSAVTTSNLMSTNLVSCCLSYLKFLCTQLPLFFTSTCLCPHANY